MGEAPRAPTGPAIVSPAAVAELERLPGFHNIVVHEYVALDMRRVVEALNRLGPIRSFNSVVAAIESHAEPQ